MALPASDELCSWKEIASHLGVSVKTAQIWEATRGMPVRRLPGPRGHVRALVSEIEAWKASAPRDTPMEPAAPVMTVEPGRPTGWWLRPSSAIVAVFLVVALGGVVLALSIGGRRAAPASVSVVQDGLVGFDRNGSPLWRHDFGPLRANAYADGERRSWVGDLDSDGQPDVLFVPVPNGLTQEPVPLVRLDARGEEIWRFTPGKTIRRGKDVFEPPFVVRQFAIINGKILVTSHHHLYYPSQVAVLDAKGRILREYWHPGHLNVLATGSYQGRTVALLGGVNNARHAATLVVLDPERLDGTAMEQDAPTFTGGAPGVEVARLLFPRSCLNQHDPYNALVNIVTGLKGIIVDVREELAATNPASVQFQLGNDLTLVDVRVSDVFSSKHRSSRAAGTLDHDWTPEEQQRLRNVTRLR